MSQFKQYLREALDGQVGMWPGSPGKTFNKRGANKRDAWQETGKPTNAPDGMKYVKGKGDKWYLVPIRST